MTSVPEKHNINGIRSGNAEADGRNHRNWFVGSFIPDPLRNSGDVEVKWAFHPKGDGKGGFVVNSKATTLSIMIRGRCRFTFQADEKTMDVLLEKEGDYALWAPGVRHDYLAEEDSLILSVRWPSIENDQRNAGN